VKAQGLFFAHFRTLFLASFGSGGAVGAPLFSAAASAFVGVTRL